MGWNDKPGESGNTSKGDKARNADSAADRAAGSKNNNSKSTGGNRKNERE